MGNRRPKTSFKQLKMRTSRDPFGYSNKLFREEVLGRDLRLAVLKFMNKISNKQQIPKSVQQCNTTIQYKNKWSRNKYDSYRGIFRLTVLRSILDGLISNDMYETIDSNLTDCNVGNRKQRNTRDSLIVLNAVLNSTKPKIEPLVDLVVYDVRKCLDTIWEKEKNNDAYELRFKNDKLPLVHMGVQALQ